MPGGAAAKASTPPPGELHHTGEAKSGDGGEMIEIPTSALEDPPRLTSTPTNLLAALAAHVEATPDRVVFTWVDKKCKVTATRTFAQIWHKAGAVADLLVKKGVVVGDRVMITYPFGLEFLPGLLGCMRAGVIACSIYPPHPAKLKTEMPKLNRFAEDAGAKFALTTRSFARIMKAAAFMGRRASVTWLATDKLRPTEERKVKDVAVRSEKIAFIQYTSGSTGFPKGVMISHGALDHNLHVIAVNCNHTQASIGCAWVPQYHDMG